MALRDFWRRVDPDSGVVVHDFSDPSHGTRFLGDLYQDLSESARKRYALLQTPEFVEEFILDRTLNPAIETFGYRVARLIDATAGSGHFLLGAFQRFLARWQREEPARNLPDLAQRALDAVYGVDINPFAVEISRFRLLIAALHACGIGLLRNAPDFRINVVAGDSLLHGRRFGQLDLGGEAENLASRYSHAYATEDLEDAEPDSRAAVSRCRRQPALHHAQGLGTQRDLPRPLQRVPHEVLARGAIHPEVLRAGDRRRG